MILSRFVMWRVQWKYTNKWNRQKSLLRSWNDEENLHDKARELAAAVYVVMYSGVQI